MAISSSVHGGHAKMVLLISVLVFTRLKKNVCKAQAVAPAIYVLGDSLVDVGNNKYLPLSIAKADFPHNGVDYPNREPTGRFSNGENSADFLAKKIGLPTSPPYLSLIRGGTPPITGVSFASGGSGIFNATGEQYIQYISLSQQVEYFSLVHDKLVKKLGASGAQIHLSKSIFLIVIGSNDLFSYFTAGSTISNQCTAQQYVDSMVSNFKGLLKSLHGLGARKIVVPGVGEIGCCPVQRKKNKTNECNVEVNYWSAKYNEGLKIMLQELKSESMGLNYVYFDTYGVMDNLFQNPKTYGFTDTKEACCGLGNLNADLPCIPTSSCCPNRKNHVFWDLYHPTEVVASLFSDILYNGSQEYVVPMNVKQLIDVN